MCESKPLRQETSFALKLKHRLLKHIQKVSWLVQPGLKPAAIAFLLGLVASIALWRLAANAIEVQAHDKFEDITSRIVSQFQRTLTAYEHVLRGGRALIETNPNTTREEFRTFVKALDIETDYPGLQGVGYSIFVKPENKNTHEEKIQSQGFEGYAITPEGQRDVYSSIIFLEPFDWRNKRAFGYDMYSNVTRRAAMDLARDTGQPSASGRVTLVQETKTDVQAGFLLYLPYYRRGEDTSTQAQRRNAIVGYVYSPFRFAKLIEGVLSDEKKTTRNYIDFAVFEGPASSSADKLMYATTDITRMPKDPDYKIDNQHEGYGQKWTFQFRSTQPFDDSIDYTNAYIALVSSLLVTTFFSLFVAAMSLRQMQLAKANKQMSLLTRELSHRVKNTLAVVQSVASRSLTKNRTIEEARNVFLKRLHALSNAHTLLLNSTWTGASLKKLARKELEPFGPRASISGPEVKLNASTAQTFALVLHELATNATKYGAMSTPSGRIHVTWKIDKKTRDPLFMFIWRESGGPLVEEPNGRGFGTTLLAQQIGHNGTAPKISYEPSGLQYEISAPLSSITEAKDDDDDELSLADLALENGNGS